MLKFPLAIFPVLVFQLLLSCKGPASNEGNNPDQDHIIPLFELLAPEATGIGFSNTLTEGLNTNVLVYEYFYNGGGIAIGDLDGDGLDDIYFTGNMVPNKLYLNKGDLKFEDITMTARVAGRSGPWATGVTMADVNGDGLLDIYVCYSGNLPPEKRQNQLFINQGSDQTGLPVFEEQAEQYGLNSESFSTQAIFFDMDKDGDLDMFLLNHNPKSLPVLDHSSTAEILRYEDPAGSQLFRNDDGKFVEVTKSAGIQNSALSYGLGVGVADLNEDGWPDIYVSNDYTAPDFLYINNRDGTFTDQSQQALGHISQFSMGSDLADINNDGLIDIYSLDMLPEDNKRQKLLMAPDNYEKFDFMVDVGFHHQYMRNMLHLNNGDGTYSEIGQLANISNTDWSWSALFADFDNDGWKDLYVTNGYQRDYTNLDFLKYMGDYVQTHQGNLKRQNILELVGKIPASDIGNYLFKNNGNLTFSNQTSSWGLDHISNSNGAAYADLDNDGDLDLIVNNVNQVASIFENKSDQENTNRYLKVGLEGEGNNRFGLGAQITIHSGGKIQLQEQMPTRGYQSSVSPVIHFGLGEIKNIDSLRIEWLSGKEQKIENVEANQLLILKEDDAKITSSSIVNNPPKLFKEASFPHQIPSRSTFNDFKRQALMTNPISGSKAALSKGDINGDGIEDLYVGGLAGFSGKLFLGNKNGSFKAHHQSYLFEDSKGSEDTEALFFDADGDGHPDLYITSGGYGNFLPEDPLLQDRLYLNDGKGGFTVSTENLPKMLSSTSCVKATDIDGDGDLDLFVGGRIKPGYYPETSESYILVNDGQGNFTDRTYSFSKELADLGMVTDAVWTDLNGDGLEDLVVVGEWMPVSVFMNSGTALNNETRNYFDKEFTGWWNTIVSKDINGDGKPDLIVGNYGLNSQVKASAEEPAELYYKDFDNNGSVDPILTFYIQGKRYPYLTRDELLEQFTNKRAKFSNYESYAGAGLEDVFSPEELKDAEHLEAITLESSVFVMENEGKFKLKKLPPEAQFAPVHSIEIMKSLTSGEILLILAGNSETGRLRLGKIDANYGMVFRVDNQGEFQYIPQHRSGLSLKGDTRNILQIENDRFLFNVVGKGLKVYELQE